MLSLVYLRREGERERERGGGSEREGRSVPATC